MTTLVIAQYRLIGRLIVEFTERAGSPAVALDPLEDATEAIDRVAPDLVLVSYRHSAARSEELRGVLRARRIPAVLFAGPVERRAMEARAASLGWPSFSLPLSAREFADELRAWPRRARGVDLV